MTNRSKNIGTAAETKVVRCIRELGFGTAERAALAGSLDRGDITGTPGICWEVKGGDAARHASDGQIGKWLLETETERRNASADIGVLVVARWRTPPERWVGHLRLLRVRVSGPALLPRPTRPDQRIGNRQDTSPGDPEGSHSVHPGLRVRRAAGGGRVSVNVPAELAAAVEAVFERPCTGGGCYFPASWTLKAPCGHDTDLCNGCALLIDAALHRTAQTGSIHVCHSTGTTHSWSEFRWVILP